MIDADLVLPRRGALRELATELAGQPHSVVEAMLHALRPRPDAAALDPAVWGRAPGMASVREAAAANLALGVDRRSSVLRSSVTRKDVARALGKSEQAVSAMLERGALLGLKQGREWRIPAWQLDPDRPEGVLPGLREVRDAFRDGVVSLTEWIERPHPDLDGETPRRALARDRVGAVVAAAASD
jgi:hypothetical protein